MREIVGALLSKREGQIAGIRVCSRMGKRFVTVARVYVKEHEPKIRDDDPDASIAPSWVETESELEDAIMEELDGLQEDGDADGWRVFAYNAAGQQIGSKMRPFPEGDDDGDDDAPRKSKSAEGLALSHMGTALADMVKSVTGIMRESRLTVGVLTTALASREAVTADALTKMTDARIGEVQAKTDAEVLEVVHTAQQAIDHAIAASPPDDDGAPNTAAEKGLAMVERFLGRFVPGGGAPVGARDVDWDAVADEVADDPTLQAELAARLAAAQARKAARDAAGESAPPKRGKRRNAKPEAPDAPPAEGAPA